MDAASWDLRYATKDLVWSPDPNVWVTETFEGRAPGMALDLATGEGRHAMWLAQRGWRVTAVDFSAEAIRKAQVLQSAHAPQTHSQISWVHDDVVTYAPARRASMAVLVMYLHLPSAQRRAVVRNAADALAVGGALLVVGHDSTNPAQGVGGPSDPEVLFTAADVVADLDGLPGLAVVRAERARRQVGDSIALDAVIEVLRTA